MGMITYEGFETSNPESVSLPWWRIEEETRN